MKNTKTSTINYVATEIKIPAIKSCLVNTHHYRMSEI